MSPGHGCGLRGGPHLRILCSFRGLLDCFVAALLAMTPELS